MPTQFLRSKQGCQQLNLVLQALQMSVHGALLMRREVSVTILPPL
jgi:hypothetical protein